MGSGKKPGHTCSLTDGTVLDGGTNCLAVSPQPGSTGISQEDANAAAKAADADLKANYKPPKSDDTTHILIDDDIKFIVQSPFGKTDEGKEIVALLKRLNKNRDIVYADCYGDRGGWDGTTISINQDFSGKKYPTIIELVHEGTHALWRQKHAKGTGNSAKDKVDDEFHAQKNQLDMYHYLRDTVSFSDMDMESRLKKLDNETLRQGIEDGQITH
jgi:hypothetical protein